MFGGRCAQHGDRQNRPARPGGGKAPDTDEPTFLLAHAPCKQNRDARLRSGGGQDARIHKHVCHVGARDQVLPIVDKRRKMRAVDDFDFDLDALRALAGQGGNAACVPQYGGGPAQGCGLLHLRSFSFRLWMSARR